MTTHLSAADVAAIRVEAAGLFWDECRLRTYQVPNVPSRYPDMSYAESEAATACNIRMDSPNETMEWTQLEKAGGRVLFPASLEGDVGGHDQIRVTKILHSELVRPVLFQIVGEPAMTLFGLRADIELVPGGVDVAALEE